ncbi:TerC family protein [Coraliomargarita parva]|uniref:TerC family protein n=1 Tax=Coraliomargarita parva TaxID=3014050 RepID=UPI0022B39CA3|nr:TerC family protein [Coraliomargarita parva]
MFDLLASAATELTTGAQSGIGNIVGVLLLLLGLELVLGVDNILVISILVARLPKDQQNTARIVGLALALVARIFLLLGVTWLLRLSTPIGEAVPALEAIPLLSTLSLKDLVLLAGGLFLIYKAVKEIHHVVELEDEHEGPHGKGHTFTAIVTQIVLLDIVFSLDSVITAVGMIDVLWVIITSVTLAFVVVLIFAKPIGDFILAHPAIKILALSFLLTIGITIMMEAFHKHVPKAYIYLPMGFALAVELLQMRYSRNKRLKAAPPARETE